MLSAVRDCFEFASDRAWALNAWIYSSGNSNITMSKLYEHWVAGPSNSICSFDIILWFAIYGNAFKLQFVLCIMVPESSWLWPLIQFTEGKLDFLGENIFPIESILPILVENASYSKGTIRDQMWTNFSHFSSPNPESSVD